jgi:hypothetical protein
MRAALALLPIDSILDPDRPSLPWLVAALCVLAKGLRGCVFERYSHTPLRAQSPKPTKRTTTR